MSPKPTRTSYGNETEDSLQMNQWSEEELQSCKRIYGCIVLKQNCRPSDAQDRSLPTDAFLVKYRVDGEIYYDVTRSSKEVKLFDMYYDRFKQDFISFEWGAGTVKPKLYGYQAPDSKKKGKR